MLYFYISLLTYACFCIFKYKEGLFYLKKDKYDSKKFLSRIKSHKSLFLNLEIISLVLIIVCFNFDSKIIGICFTVLYMFLSLYKIKNNNVIKKDKKNMYRVIFIILFYVLLNVWFVLDYVSYHGKGLHFDNSPLYYIVLVLFGYLSYFVIYISNVICKLLRR
ncbi:MAG: hypothetical protein IKE75_01975 [Bacilli bacterium]|nr:hypothetical protein [Bacilli bacterium]